MKKRLATRRSLSRISTGLFQKLFTYFICSVIALQPMMTQLAHAQQVIIDPNGNVGFKPTLKIGSRPQVVDIVKPNSGGVSHNKYDRLDVTSRGVVLNNSKTTSNTTLRGNVSANPNLTGNTAAVILNEVTTSRQSVLNGSVEVAGDRAKVIIANPNGITCNGCGFINASEGTLTTGVPTVSGGDVSVAVRQGTITVGRNGFKGRAGTVNQIDTVNLIGRSVKIDGPVDARNMINIQGGSQTYNITTRRKTGTQTGTGATPLYTVDATEFGAMDAGRIQIVGTERGLGVRALGSLKASNNQGAILNEGDIQVRSLNAAKRAQIFSRYGNVEIENDIVSTGANVDIYARRDLETFESTGIYGKTAVKVRSNQGRATLFGEIQSDGNIDVLARYLDFSSYASTAGNLKFDVQYEMVVDGATIVANAVSSSRTLRELELKSSAFFSFGDVEFNTGNFRLGSEVLVDSADGSVASNLKVAATGTFTNNADLRNHADDVITYGGNFVNESQGIVEQARLAFNLGGTLNNEGILYGETSVDIDVNNFINGETGAILGGTVSIDAANNFRNSGSITADGTLRLASPKTITNDGFVQAKAAYLNGLSIVNNAQGEIRSETMLDVRGSQSVTNVGLMGTLGRFIGRSDDFDNQGQILSDLDQALVVGAFSNSGSMIAGTKVNVQSAGLIANTGSITAYEALTLTSGTDVRNTDGTLLSDGSLFISGAVFNNLGGDSLVRAQSLSLNAKRFENEGDIYLTNDFNNKNRIEYLRNDGVLASGGRFEITGFGTNSQLIVGENGAFISGLRTGNANDDLLPTERMILNFNSISSDGLLASGGYVSATANTLSLNGRVRGEEGLYLTAPTLTVGTDAVLETPGRARIITTREFKNAGLIAAGDYLELGAGFGTFSNSGVISAKYARKWATGTFNNTGVIQMDTSLALEASSFVNSGHVQGKSYISVTTTGDAIHRGTMSSEGFLRFTARRTTFDNDSKTAGGSLQVKGARFYNYGDTVLSDTRSNVRNEITLTEGMYQKGITYSPLEFRINAASFTGYGNSVLSGDRRITITTPSNINASGAITGRWLNLNAASLSGASSGTLIASADATILVTGALRHDGEISTGNITRLEGDTVDLRGNTFGRRVLITSDKTLYTRGQVIANDTITATSGGYFENRGLIEAQTKAKLTSGQNFRNRSTGTIRSTDLEIKATGWFTNDKTVFAASDLNIDALAFNNSAGATATAVGVGIETRNHINNAGTIDGYGVFAKAGTWATNSGTIKTKTYLGFEAASFTNAATGKILGTPLLDANNRPQGESNVFVTASGAMVNDGQIRGDNIDLRAATFKNNNFIAAVDVVNVADATGDVENTSKGRIYGKVITLLGTGNLRNDGTIGQINSNSYSKAEDVYLAGANINNYKHIYGKEVRVNASGYIVNRTAATLRGTDYVGLKSGSYTTNQGNVQGKEAFVEARTGFDNQYRFKLSDKVSIQAATIRNRTLNNRKAELEADNVVLLATDWVSNSGELFGYDSLGVKTINGSITNTGQITGPDITLISEKSGVYSTSGIYAGGTLSIAARSIGLSANVTVTDAITLYTSHYDIAVEGALTTKSLKIEAARDLKAKSGLLRGSVLTQIVADDIKRQTSATAYSSTSKLAILHSGIVKNDVYVRLRDGSIGTYVDNQGDKDVFDAVNLDVKGDLTLIADNGNFALRGTLKSDKRLFVRANRGSTSLKDITLASGNLMHLSGRNYLKNHGNVRLDPGTKLELSQTYGWLYTADWFRGDMDYHLTVDAKQIVVNSDHRLVNHDLILRASQDIVQRNSVISARGVTYGAGRDVKITFSPFVWRDEYNDFSAASLDRRYTSFFGALLNGVTTARNRSWWDVSDAGLRGHTLIAQQKGINIYAGQDVKLTSGKIHTTGSMEIVASRNLLSEPIYLETGKNNRPGSVGWDFSGKYKGVISGHDASKVEIRELRAYENQLSANKGVTLRAGGFVTLIGTKVSSTEGDIRLQAENGGVNLVAAPGYWTYNYSKTTTKRKAIFFKKRTTVTYTALNDIYKRTNINSARGNVFLESKGDQDNQSFASVLSAGSKIKAKKGIYVKTKAGDISLGTYAERTVTESTKTSSTKLLFIPLGSSSSSDKRHVTVNYGNNFAADSILDIDSGRDLNIQDGEFSAPTKRITAAGNINIIASINTAKREYFSESTNLITITTINSGYNRETASLPRITGAPPTFDAGGDVFIRGARGATLNDQLLSLLSSTTFEDPLDDLFTAPERSGAAEASATINDEFLRDFVLPGASDGAQFAYLDDLVANGATYETIRLRDQEWYDKQVQLNPAFQALLQVVATYVTGGAAAGLGISNTFVAAGVNAFTADLVAGVVGGAITGDVDLGDILEGAALRGFTVGVSSAVTASFNLNEILGVSDNTPFLNDLSPDITAGSLIDGLGDTIANTVVSNVIQGNDPFENIDDALRGFAVGQAMAIAQFQIGEVGVGQANWEGSFGHLLLHGGVGCVALEALDGDCVAGFFSGASSSILAGSNLSDEQKRDLAPLVGAIAAFPLANGLAANVSFGGTISQSAIQNNYLRHAEAAQRSLNERRLEECLQSGDCTAAEMAGYRETIAYWNAIDAELDANLRQACDADSASELCRGLIREALQFSQRFSSPIYAMEQYIGGSYDESAARARDWLQSGEDFQVIADEYARIALEQASTDALLLNYSDTVSEIIGSDARLLLAEGALAIAGGVVTRPRTTIDVGPTPTSTTGTQGSLTTARFAQVGTNPSRVFSSQGRARYSNLAGRPISTIDDLALAIRNREIRPNQVEVDYVNLNGTRLILNTRTSMALIEADIPRNQWLGVDRTGQVAYRVDGQPVTFDDLATNQLTRNELGPTGAPSPFP